jgi:hypothetical protein
MVTFYWSPGQATVNVRASFLCAVAEQGAETAPIGRGNSDVSIDAHVHTMDSILRNHRKIHRTLRTANGGASLPRTSRSCGAVMVLNDIDRLGVLN